jgi:ATP-dependent RNA helicase DDX54/DBP10
MGRAVSPAMSDAEVDISKNLFTGDVFDSDSEEEIQPASEQPKNKKRKTDNVVDAFEDDDDEDEAFIAATQVKANRKSENKVAKKAGAFQSMGLNAVLLKAITRKGFNVPTPIQRKTVPLIMDGQDVVGMARTGSGKTAAFVIPMIEKLKSHSAKVGARAIVLSPSRELALQTLKVVKEMGRGTDLRSTLLVGGDSLEDQFSSMASNPDIIIATPGRFEHLKVEMGLELSSVKYVVFDEADRLFEMGFAAQLTEIMHSQQHARLCSSPPPCQNRLWNLLALVCRIPNLCVWMRRARSHRVFKVLSSQSRRERRRLRFCTSSKRLSRCRQERPRR